MKRLAGAGALIATSQLPVLAEDKPGVFPQRGGYDWRNPSQSFIFPTPISLPLIPMKMPRSRN